MLTCHHFGLWGYFSRFGLAKERKLQCCLLILVRFMFTLTFYNCTETLSHMDWKVSQRWDMTELLYWITSGSQIQVIGSQSWCSLRWKRGLFYHNRDGYNIPALSHAKAKPPGTAATIEAKLTEWPNRGITISASGTWCHWAQKDFSPFTYMGKDTSVNPWIKQLS